MIALVLALAAATVLGLAWQARQGRVRTGRVRGSADGPAPVAVPGERGSAATLLQFSSAVCAPCRVTRRTLAGVAAERDGVAHVELDVEEHLDLASELGVWSTPTTLLLDAAGREAARISGPPRPAEVLAALDALAA